MKTRFGNYIVESDEDYLRLHYRRSVRDWGYGIFHILLGTVISLIVLYFIKYEMENAFFSSIFVIVGYGSILYVIGLLFLKEFRLFTRNILLFDKKTEELTFRYNYFRKQTLFKEEIREIEYGFYVWFTWFFISVPGVSVENPGRPSSNISGKLVFRSGKKFDVIYTSNPHLFDSLLFDNKKDVLATAKSLIAHLSKELQIGKRWRGEVKGLDN